MTPLKIDPEFESLFPPLTGEEFAALEQSILRDGCRHALIVWNGFLVDGHNRYKICKKHGLAFPTTHLDRTDTREAVIGWMINNQLARRNLSEFKRIELAAKKSDLIAALAKKKKTAGVNQHSSLSSNLTEGSPIDTRKEIAKAAGVSTGSVSKFNKIMERAVPEVIEKVSAGEVAIDVASLVADLPKEKQSTLAAEGNASLKAAAKESRQASKRNRNAARDAAPEAKEAVTAPKPGVTSPPEDEDELARLRIENAALRSRVEELTAASKNIEIENQLAEAHAEVQRLTGVCQELNIRIAALKQENGVLAERRNVQDQTDHEPESAKVTVENCSDVLVEQPANDPVVVDASSPVTLDASAEPNASITIGEHVDVDAVDEQPAAEGTC